MPSLWQNRFVARRKEMTRCLCDLSALVSLGVRLWSDTCRRRPARSMDNIPYPHQPPSRYTGNSSCCRKRDGTSPQSLFHMERRHACTSQICPLLPSLCVLHLSGSCTTCRLVCRLLRLPNVVLGLDWPRQCFHCAPLLGFVPIIVRGIGESTFGFSSFDLREEEREGQSRGLQLQFRQLVKPLESG